MGRVQKKNKWKIETGITAPLTPGEVIARYLRFPGQVLTLVRIFNHEGIEEIFDRITIEREASRINIEMETLMEYEKGIKVPPYQEVPTLAKGYGIRTKILMELFGHAKPKKTEDDFDFGIAAQYSGRDLTEQEKIDLKELVKMISGEE